MDARVDLSLLAAFVAVAETLSFSSAAKRLGVTTATVSRDVARLEKLAGAELIHRTTRRVSLSTAGESLFSRAGAHVGALHAALQSMPERHDEPAGTLRLTAPYGLGATLLGDVIARFTARFPRVKVDAHFTNRNVDLVAEGFDLAIRGAAGMPKDSRLNVRRLKGLEVLRFYASPGYLARRGMPHGVGAVEHEWLVFGALAKNLKLLPRMEARIIADDFLFLREATRAGAGVGLLPVIVARPLVTSGDLVPVLTEVRPSVGGMVLLYPAQGPVARKVTAFRDMFIASLGEDAGAPGSP